MPKMTLKGYYDSLSQESPQVKFRKAVEASCNISRSTFYNYVQGRWPVPDELKPTIAAIADKSTDELFSNK